MAQAPLKYQKFPFSPKTLQTSEPNFEPPYSVYTYNLGDTSNNVNIAVSDTHVLRHKKPDFQKEITILLIEVN